MNGSKMEENDNLVLGLSSAPEIFVEGYRGAMSRAGVIKLNFFANRFNPTTERIEKHGAVTLSVPLVDFEQIVEALSTLIQEFREKEAASKDPSK